MNADDYARVREVFSAARRLQGRKREEFLAAECEGDVALRNEVESLLRANVDAVPLTGSRDRRRALESVFEVDHETVEHPERIGSYRIVGVLGEGGMGIVYEAQQERPRRTVALKVLKHVTGDWRRARFEREARALARLQHPGIAQVYDAGVAQTPGGLAAYLAMELVRGERLDAFVRREDLDIGDTLELFCRVCDAVDAAHRQGVVHRDLKPDNILVVRDANGIGRPKLLDFGIARVLDDEYESLSLHTEPGQLLGTLPYMSPEQMVGNSQAVDQRTDVYALGVLLFELLAGRLPFYVGGLSIPEAARVLHEADAPRLATLDTRWRGDLDTIVATALARDPDRRYASAAALAEDMRRHLAHEPILARPTGRVERMAKFTRRHRALVGGTAAALAGLLLTIVALWFRARDLERADRLNTATLSALEHFLRAADPLPVRDYPYLRHIGPNATIGEVLGDMALSLKEKPPADPDVAATLHLRIGWALYSGGRWREAQWHLERALEVWQGRRADDDLLVLEAETALAFALTQLGFSHRALPLAVRTEEALRHAGPDTLHVWLAAVICRGYAGMKSGVRRAQQQMARRLREADIPDAWQRDFAEFFACMGTATESLLDGDLRPARQALEAARNARSRLGPQRHMADFVLHEAAVIEASQSLDDDRAIREAEAVEELLLEMVGADSDWRLFTGASEAIRRWSRADGVAARQEMRRVVEEHRSRLGPENPRTLYVLRWLAWMELQAGDAAEFELLFAQRQEQVSRSDHAAGEALLEDAHWAQLLVEAGAGESAMEWVEQVIETARRPAPEWSASALVEVARLLQLLERDRQALELIDRVLAGWQQQGPMARGPVLHALDLQGQLYLALDDPGKAMQSYARLFCLYDEGGLLMPGPVPQWRLRQGDALAAAGETAAARKSYEAALAGFVQTDRETVPDADRARQQLRDLHGR